MRKTKLNSKIIIRWTILSSCALFTGLVLFMRFSPYKKLKGFDRKGIYNSMVIDKPVDTVFDFMCRSNESKKWMHYIDHIDVLANEPENSTEVGKISRFYANSDETGQQY